jgi:KDO2-lipid IV(A) lauroyltransferase
LKRRRRREPRPIQKVRRYLVYLFSLVLRRIILWLPFRISFVLSSFLTSLGYWILPRQRRRMLFNLSRAFGKEKNKKELKQIARKVFRNIGRSSAEVICWSKLGKDYLEKHVTIKNPEILFNAYKNGKGVIGLTAHLGNWEYLAAFMANILRIRFSVIARNLSNKWLNRLMEETRKSMNINVLYRGDSGISILRTLKRNEGLGILADQHIRGEGIMVDFFGYPAKTLRNVAELILRSGATVVPLFIVRNKDLTKHTLIVENPLSYTPTGDKELDLKNISQTYTNLIESYIRRYPEQWVWMHNRWDVDSLK